MQTVCMRGCIDQAVLRFFFHGRADILSTHRLFARSASYFLWLFLNFAIILACEAGDFSNELIDPIIQERRAGGGCGAEIYFFTDLCTSTLCADGSRYMKLLQPPSKLAF